MLLVPSYLQCNQSRLSRGMTCEFYWTVSAAIAEIAFSPTTVVRLFTEIRIILGIRVLHTSELMRNLHCVVEDQLLR
jgi:hypothetical protein